MRLRKARMYLLVASAMIGKALEEEMELMRLCVTDNLGVRFIFMYIYAFTDDEESGRNLFRWSEKNSEPRCFPSCLFSTIGSRITRRPPSTFGSSRW